MNPPSSLFLLLPSITLVSCHLPPGYHTSRELKEEKEIFGTGVQDRQPRSVSTLKVLDFSDDNDQKRDSNDSVTGASLKVGSLPESFTVCTALMVEAWTNNMGVSRIFDLIGTPPFPNPPVSVLTFQLLASYGYTEYSVGLLPERNRLTYINQTTGFFLPLRWTLSCLSLDKNKIKVVVDRQLLVEEEVKREASQLRLDNITINLGFFPGRNIVEEYPVRIANLNVFTSSLSVERMIAQTTAGGEECGAPGDLVSWEEAEWTLHSQAKVIEVDREWEGPCRRESQVQVFSCPFAYHENCMRHCQKISNGRAPALITKEDWENMTKEIDLITPDFRDSFVLSWIYLSATEGDIYQELAKLAHWPETEIVGNETIKLEAVERVWRDYYTGQRLDNWTKPYYQPEGDINFGEDQNCMASYTEEPWDSSWGESACGLYDMSCACSYPTTPLLRLRGLCPASLLDYLYSPKQLPANAANMILLGHTTDRIEYNDTTSQWILTSAKSDTPLLERRKCWAKSILPRAGYRLGAYRTVDIFNFSLI